MVKIAVVVAGIYVLFFLLVQIMETGMLYHPIRSYLTDGELSSRGIQRYRLKTPDGPEIDVWYCSGDSLTLLLCHGNAGSNDDRLEQVLRLNAMGHGVVLFDYRGYGVSSGHPTEKGLYRDAHAVYDWMIAKQHIKESRIVVYGTSLGAAVAAELACQTNPRSLILETAMTSKLEIARDIMPFFPAFLFTWDQFETVRYLNKVHVPVLITHGTADEVIPYSHGERLFQAAREPKFFLSVPGAHHNDIWIVGGNPYFDSIHRFTTTGIL